MGCDFEICERAIFQLFDMSEEEEEDGNERRDKKQVLASAPCGVLAVPGSAVACDRIWSSAGRAFTKPCSSLSAETGGGRCSARNLKAGKTIEI